MNAVRSLLFSLLVFLAPAFTAQAQRFTPPNHALFPLEANARWVYRGIAAGGKTLITRRVARVTRTDTGKRAEIAEFIRGVPPNMIRNRTQYELRAGQIYESWSYQTRAEVGTTTSSLLLPGREVLQEGYTWTTDLGFTHESPIVTGEARMVERHRVVGWEWVRVPAGRFYALRIDTQITLAGVEHHKALGDIPLPEETGRWSTWYAPFVGAVKTQAEGGTEKLVSYNIRPDPCEYAVIGLQGTVELNGKPLGAEIGYAPSQRVRTYKNSSLRMMLGSGEILRVGENTTYEIEQATVCGLIKEPQTVTDKVARIVKILLGKLWFTIGSWVGPKDRPLGTRIEGGHSGGGVRGTVFSLEVTETYDLWEVIEGTIEVTDYKTGKVFVLRAGEKKRIPQ